jgi:hypothetical protein
MVNSDEVCPKFRCSKLATDLAADTCISFKDGFHEIQNKCTSPKKCIQPKTSEEDTTCSANPILLEDDKTCKDGAECRSGNCEKATSKCVSLAKGVECTSSAQCQKGLYCDASTEKHTCLEQKTGGSCKSDEECVNSQGCNALTCTPLFSIADGAIADRPVFCQSGDFEGDLQTPGKCITTTLTSEKMECALGTTTCNYKDATGGVHTKNCGCSFSDGKRYCPLASDQKAFKDYVSGFQKYYKNNAQAQHTVYRWNVGADLNKLKWNAVNYPELKDADKCTVQVFTNAKIYAISVLSFLAMIFLF